MSGAIGLLETTSWTQAIIAIDAAEKAASVTVVQAELNDMLGASVKLAGAVAAIAAALAAAEAIAGRPDRPVTTRSLNRPTSQTAALWSATTEYNALIEQDVIYIPRKTTMADVNQAIGLIETQGFTAVIEAIDAATKAAAVELIGREKLGGGYICVALRGDVAAVKAAVDAARSRIEQLALGKLIATHVIARPSNAVLGLLPKA